MLLGTAQGDGQLTVAQQQQTGKCLDFYKALPAAVSQHLKCVFQHLFSFSCSRWLT